MNMPRQVSRIICDSQGSKHIFYRFFFVLFLAATFICLPDNTYPQDKQSPTSLYYKWIKNGSRSLPEVRNALSSPDWHIRTHALLALGKIGEPSDIPRILSRLDNDPNVNVKNCAIAALGDMKAKQAVPLLLSMLNRTADSKARPPWPYPRTDIIIESLGKIGDNRATIPLCKILLSSGSEQIRRKAKDALTAIGDPRAADLLISAFHKNKKKFPAVEAAWVISLSNSADAEDFLLELFLDPDPRVKNAAAIGLAHCGTAKSVRILTNEFACADSYLRKNISDALVAIDDESEIPVLCSFLSSKDTAVAMDAASILSRLSSPKSGTAVFKIFASDPRTNGPAAVVLGRKKVTKAIWLLRKRLKDVNMSGRNEMAEALGRLGDKDSIPLLIRLAQKNDPSCSRGAIIGLGELEAVESVPVLIDLLKQGNLVLLPDLLYSLGKIGDKRAVKPIIEVLYESGMSNPLAFGLALAQIGGNDVADFILANAKSLIPKRRRLASFMLLKSSGKEMIPVSIELLTSNDPDIKNAAITALSRICGKKFNSIEEWRNWWNSQKRGPEVQD